MNGMKELGKQKMLHVVWSEREEATYYVDKDEYSKAHDLGNVVTLKAFEGTHTFDKTSLRRGRSAAMPSVTLDTGTEKRQTSIISWKLFDAPTPA